MDGGDVSSDGKVTCASWIKRPENAHLVLIGKSTGTSSLLEIFSFNKDTTSLSSSPKVPFSYFHKKITILEFFNLLVTCVYC